MWINERYSVARPMDWLRRIIDYGRLANIISHVPVRLAHMPVELYENANDGAPELLWHIPRVDPIVNALEMNQRVTISIPGWEEYISPTLYCNPGLPTVNYAVAELTDTVRVLSDAELEDHMRRLVVLREQQFAELHGAQPWKLTEKSAEQRFSNLLPRIAGFAIGIDTLQVKVKMGQNRDVRERSLTNKLVRNMNVRPNIPPSIFDLLERL